METKKCSVYGEVGGLLRFSALPSGGGGFWCFGALPLQLLRQPQRLRRFEWEPEVLACGLALGNLV